MINLKELAYRRTITSKPYQIFPLHPKFQLETLIWAVDPPGCQYHLAASGRPLYEGRAFQFLESQPQLRDLLWNIANPCIVVPSYLLCPNLKSPQGNADILNVFLPRRSITTVNLMPDAGCYPRGMKKSSHEHFDGILFEGAEGRLLAGGCPKFAVTQELSQLKVTDIVRLFF